MRRTAVLFALLSLPTVAPAQAPPARLCEGRIQDVLGDGIPAARVQALVNGRPIANAVADGEGVYRIRVPASGALLVVTSPGRVAERLSWRGETTPKVRNVVLEDAGVLRGRVLDQRGAPVAAAMVIAASRAHSATALTDAEGRYELAAPLRELNVRAVAEHGWAETSLRLYGDTACDLVFAAAAGPCLVQVANLPAGQVGAVRIFGPDLAAVADGGVVALRDDASARLFVRTLCLVQGQVPGHQLAPAVQLAGPATGRLDFAVQGPAAAATASLLRGEVRTGTGQPVEGVRVVVRDRSQCELGAVTTGRGGAFEVRVAVPADGFVRVGLRLAEWIVLHDDLWLADGFAWAPCPSGANLPVELVVEPAGVLRDVVQPPGGSTFAFAEVVVADPDRPHKPLVVLQSDFNGAIDVGLPPGTCEVLAISPDGEVCRAIVGVVPGTPVRPQWQAIATGTVEGTLRDERGKGLGGVEVFLGSLNAGADARASERYSCRVRTDRHGRFRCRGVPIGDWSIVASEGARSDSTAGIVERAGTLAVELSLPPR